MEVIFTAIMGEIANRSASFLIGKYSKDTTATMEESLHSLNRVLLRVRVIVEEAEERHIRNQAMVHQLNILRKEMYRGYYVLDNFRNQTSEEHKARDHEVSQSFALSKFNPAKRLFLSSNGGTRNVNELHQVIENLNNMIIDMSEFVAFLKNYPPLYRQPYSMHLFLDKCMFCRQMETERIMTFLMQIESPNTGNIGVLPIIGPPGVGKSTLVALVYNSERVRNHFSRIVLITEDDLQDKQITLKDGCVTIHRNNALKENERLLVIIELSGEADEVAWNRLSLASADCLASGAKIIITSRSNRIAYFGTTQALILNALPPEAYWYFFKVLIFGGTDPQDQPKLKSIALKIAREMNGSFDGANFFSDLLRNNVNTQHWCMVLTFIRVCVQRTLSLFGEHPAGPVKKKKRLCIRRMDNNAEFVLYDWCRTSFANGVVPNITLYDVLFGSVKCQGRFKVLVCKSHIPPYTSFIATCAAHKPQLIEEPLYVPRLTD